MWKLVCYFILLQIAKNNVYSSWTGGVGDGSDDLLEQCKAKSASNIRECPKLESYHPWEEQSESCKNYTVKTSNTPLPPTALVSFFMSGNLYLLQLVEQTSGLMTGVLFPAVLTSQPRSKVACGIKFDDGKTILQSNYDIIYDLIPAWHKKYLIPRGEKRNWPTLSATYFNYRGILLVRNPWLTIIETRRKIQIGLRQCNTCPSRSRTLRQTSDYQGKAFGQFVSFAARQWVAMLRTWITNSPFRSDLVIVKYEDLIRNPELELRRILKFLNVTVDEERLKCALNDGTYIDTVATVQDVDVVEKAFESGQVNQLLEAGIKEINQLLTKKGIALTLEYEAPNWETLTRSESLWTRKVNPL